MLGARGRRDGSRRASTRFAGTRETQLPQRLVVAPHLRGGSCGARRELSRRPRAWVHEPQGPPTQHSANPAEASATNSLTLASSFRPLASSTPVWTSTPAGRTAAIACRTLAGVSPPARITGRG